MGGRKGHSLKQIVGDLRSIIPEKRELLRGIEEDNPKKVVRASAHILSKSDEALESLAYGYLFVDSIEGERGKLQKKSIKERRKALTKKWTLFRKKAGKSFNPEINRNVVDSTTRILGGRK